MAVIIPGHITRHGHDEFIIDGNGLVIGHASQAAFGGVTSEAQVLGTNEPDASLAIGLWSTVSSRAPTLKLMKSADGVIADGSFVTVADNEELGRIQAYGDDGTDFDTLVAQILFEVDDASVATGAIGGAVVLSTATSAGTLTEAVRIDSSQRVLIGHTVALGRLGQLFEVTAEDNYAGAAFNTFSTSVDQAPLLDLNRSKSGDIGTYTIVATNDRLGAINFRGSDGVADPNGAFLDGAQITAFSDTGTPSSTSMPTRLSFRLVGDGSTTLTEQLRIAEDGGLFAYNLLAAAASTDLNVNGSNEIHSVTSSAEYKKAIKPTTVDSSKIYNLAVKDFTWNAKSGSPDVNDFGLIAEEAAVVHSDLVVKKRKQTWVPAASDSEGQITTPGFWQETGIAKPYSIRHQALTHMVLLEVQKINARLVAAGI